MILSYYVVYVYVSKICGEKFGGCWWSFSWLGQSNPVVCHLHCAVHCPNESRTVHRQFRGLLVVCL